MVKEARMPCVGLFGTCGSSRWRDRFIRTYDLLGIRFFNPQVEEWDPSMADIEKQHLATDELILFPVTSETSGLGSLSETGFSILQVLQDVGGRDLIIMIDPSVDTTVEPAEAKASLRSRRLVQAHLEEFMATRDPLNVFVVNDLDEMLALSIHLHGLRLSRVDFDDQRRTIRRTLAG